MSPLTITLYLGIALALYVHRRMTSEEKIGTWDIFSAMAGLYLLAGITVAIMVIGALKHVSDALSAGLFGRFR